MSDRSIDMFESIEYKVGIYRTISAPYYLAVDIESPACIDTYKHIKLGERQYVYVKVWIFEGPRKSVYSGIMNRIIHSAKILPVTGIARKQNPNNRAVFELSDDKYEVINKIIDGVITGLTINVNDEQIKPRVIVNNKSTDAEDAVNDGILMSFNQIPSALIIPSGPISKKNRPKLYPLGGQLSTIPSRRSDSPNWKRSSNWASDKIIEEAR